MSKIAIRVMLPTRTGNVVSHTRGEYRPQEGSPPRITPTMESGLTAGGDLKL